MSYNLLRISGANRKRVGRGISAGQGKTAGRGTKGQKSRSGFNIPRKFEGGQMPLSMRLPKNKGFNSHQDRAEVIGLETINKTFKNGEVVSMDELKKRGLIKKTVNKVKILNNGELKIAVKFEVPFSKSIVMPKDKVAAKKTSSDAKLDAVVTDQDEKKTKSGQTPKSGMTKSEIKPAKIIAVPKKAIGNSKK